MTGTQPVARAVTPAPPARLEVSSLSKTFGSHRVLADIAFDVRPGEIHALVGQNGSGKSTVAKILSGLYTPDTGSVVSVDGQALGLPVRPDEARRRGVGVVHQNLGLLPSFTVLENVRIGRLRATGMLRRIDWRHERAEAAAVFERIGREIPLEARVGELNEEERSTVAIARALQDSEPGRGLLIFDESTRALSRRSLERFFTLLDEIVSTGTAVLMITHRLEEVLDAADRVTVLRDGRAVASGRDVRDMDETGLTGIILGKGLAAHASRDPAADAAAPEVRVDGLSGHVLRPLDVTIRRGEVVGFTGIAGAGHEEIPYLLAGATRALTGRIRLPDIELPAPGLDVAAAMSAGIALIPESREHAGLAMQMSVSENVSFPHTSTRGGSLLPSSIRGERERSRGWIDRLDVRPPRAEAPVATFSGGNQQKVLLAKWLSKQPTLLVLHEPTQAVDVGARRTIAAAIHDAAAAGSHVVVASADENELAMLCDRVLVLEEGRVVRELRAPLTADDIVAAIYAAGKRSRLRSRAEL